LSEKPCGAYFFAFFENFFVPILTSGGYVGLSIATLLSQHHKVTAVDIIPEKVDMINNRKSPIQDDYIEKYLAEKELNLTATLDAKAAYSDADFVVIAAPTNYDSHTQHFDTSAVEAVIKLVMEYNPDAIMVIKSTIPVGYTASIREKFNSKNIIFSPEFLRESKSKSFLHAYATYVPYFYIIKPTPVQPLAAAVAEALILTFHRDPASWTPWKLNTPLIRAHFFYLPRPPVSRGK